MLYEKLLDLKYPLEKRFALGEDRTRSVWVKTTRKRPIFSDFRAKKKIESNSIGWVVRDTPARQCCPATVRRGGFWLLPFGPDPCALSLEQPGQTRDYSTWTMLTPFLARTSLQHCVSITRIPILKPFNKLRLRSHYRPALPGPSERRE